MLFLVPSIALLGQTLREWTSDAEHPIRPICVCSDSRISKKYSKNDDIDVFKTIDLALPATTDSKEVARQLRLNLSRKEKGMTVVFSTYQSIEVVIHAQQHLQSGADDGYGRFDLVICDEAHRTTGVTLKGEESSAFTKVHDEELLDERAAGLAERVADDVDRRLPLGLLLLVERDVPGRNRRNPGAVQI